MCADGDSLALLVLLSCLLNLRLQLGSDIHIFVVDRHKRVGLLFTSAYDNLLPTVSS